MGILLKAFGDWCLLRGGYWWWEVSWMAAVHIGADQRKTPLPWTKEIYSAFLAGCWFLFWTDDTVYWAAKPTVHVERLPDGSRRLHNLNGPACENDVESLYFVNGVLVPAYAVVQPELISVAEIKGETNEEVRRVLIERFGWERFLTETNAKIVDRRFNERDRQWEELRRLEDGTQRVLLVDPSTGRRYALGCPRDVATCQAAQNFLSHGLDARAVHRS